MDLAVWIVLRVVYAWMFLVPLSALLRDWAVTEQIVALVCPVFTRIASVVMVAVMFVGALSILLGVYAQIGGILLLIYCLLGVVVHYRLAGLVLAIKPLDEMSEKSRELLQQAQNLGVAGHISSGQKNIVLAAVAFLFIMMGSGPLSMSNTLW